MGQEIGGAEGTQPRCRREMLQVAGDEGVCAARYGDFEKGSIIGIRQNRVQRSTSDRFTHMREEG